jgi:hypothetical protein
MQWLMHTVYRGQAVYIQLNLQVVIPWNRGRHDFGYALLLARHAKPLYFEDFTIVCAQDGEAIDTLVCITPLILHRATHSSKHQE